MRHAYTATDSTISMTDSEAGEVIILNKDAYPEAFEETLTYLMEGDIAEAWQTARNAEHWLISKFGVHEEDGNFSFEGTPIDPQLAHLINNFTEGDDRWKHFIRRLSQNPSKKVTDHLFRFLSSCPGITIDENGCVLAFKGVQYDLTDVQTGFNEHCIGAEISMPRNQVEDDPEVACAAGLHAGSLSYATNWGHRVVIVRIDPKDVVSVPYDTQSQKLRCCAYKVVSEVAEAKAEAE